ncbi:MAG: POTRA domain-containing protein, partial [Bacteroidales bacterium]
MTSIRTTISVFFLVIFVMIMQSCAPTKYVGEDQYLLNRYRIEDEKSDIPKEEFRNFVKQKPNKRFLGWKFWLSIYNLSGKDSTSGLNRWLKEIGEPPVIYSEDMKENTVQQLEMFLFNKGYFDAHIGDTTLIKKKKANVIYRIEPGKPHYIGNIDYFFEDALLSQYIMGDSASFILKTDQKYDVDNFRAENMRIEEILRNTGYYNFTRDYIYYQVDSTTSSRQVNVTMGIRNYPERDRLGNMIRTQHPTYKVGRVYMKTGSDVIGLSGSSESSRLDTTRNGDVIVISDPDVRIRHELVAQKNYIIPGDLYNQRKVQQTYRNLTALSVFRLVDINFTVVEGQKNLLDCEIQMLPSVKQAFTGGIESTTSGGNIGAAGNLNYQHRNLFGGSERFDLTFLGAIETLPENPDKPPEELGTMQELGMEASLKLPQFLLPFRTDQFIRKFNPETNFNL